MRSNESQMTPGRHEGGRGEGREERREEKKGREERRGEGKIRQPWEMRRRRKRRGEGARTNEEVEGKEGANEHPHDREDCTRSVVIIADRRVAWCRCGLHGVHRRLPLVSRGHDIEQPHRRAEIVERTKAWVDPTDWAAVPPAAASAAAASLEASPQVAVLRRLLLLRMRRLLLLLQLPAIAFQLAALMGSLAGALARTPIDVDRLMHQLARLVNGLIHRFRHVLHHILGDAFQDGGHALALGIF